MPAPRSCRAASIAAAASPRSWRIWSHAKKALTGPSRRTVLVALPCSSSLIITSMHSCSAMRRASFSFCEAASALLALARSALLLLVVGAPLLPPALWRFRISSTVDPPKATPSLASASAAPAGRCASCRSFFSSRCASSRSSSSAQNSRSMNRSLSFSSSKALSCSTLRRVCAGPAAAAACGLLPPAAFVAAVPKRYLAAPNVFVSPSSSSSSSYRIDFVAPLVSGGIGLAAPRDVAVTPLASCA